MTVLLWLLNWWTERQRAIDIKVFWPECKEQAAGNLPLARDMFLIHAFSDPVWQRLGEREIIRRVGELT